MPSPVLLTTAEVADIFRVAPETITRWVREGTISAQKAPGKGGYRFRRVDVEALLSPAPEAAK